MNVLELFGGIGAFTEALKTSNIKHKVLDYVEIDKYAVKSYNAMNNTEFEPQDISKWDKEIEVDFIMHGSPCQSFSIAGKQEGGFKGSGTRSSLMWETVRIIHKLKPKFILWENVKNVLSGQHRINLLDYITDLKNLGYTSYFQVMNTKDYGIPQNRERVFVLSIINDFNEEYFEFPKPIELKLRLKDMLEDKVDDKYNIDLSKFKTVKEKENYLQLDDERCYESQQNRIYMQEGNTGTLTASFSIPLVLCNYDLKSREFQNTKWKDISSTLCARDYKDPKIVLKTNDMKVRKLTPRECWRLQDFRDEQYEKASKVNSNSQLYKQAGNSISVNVLRAILNQMLKYGYIEKEE